MEPRNTGVCGLSSFTAIMASLRAVALVFRRVNVRRTPDQNGGDLVVHFPETDHKRGRSRVEKASGQADKFIAGVWRAYPCLARAQSH